MRVSACIRFFNCSVKRGDGTVKAKRGPRVQLDFAERCVFVEHVDGAKLIEIEADVRLELGLQNLRAQINVLGPDERADAGALVPLLDLVPPAIDLIAHHAQAHRQRARSAGASVSRDLSAPATDGEELPAGKDADAAGGRRFDGHLFFVAFGFGSESATPLLAQARMNRGQQVFGYGRFSKRQKLRLVQAGLRALRLRIELADGIDFVAEKLDADGPIGFGRVDIENSAAARELARHFHQVHLRVAHAGQMRGEDFDVHLFAAAQLHGQAGIVFAIEEAKRGGFDGRDQMSTAPVASFHRAAARCSCTSGCGERFSNGSTS